MDILSKFSRREEFRKTLTPEQLVLEEFIYERTKNPIMATLFWGVAMAAVFGRPEATYWEIVAEVKDTIDKWEMGTN